MFARLIATLSGTAPRTPIRNANRFRPRVEGLESRDVPASYFWHPTSGLSATLAVNWVSPDAPDTLPTDGADVNFADVKAGSTLDCNDFGLASGSYHSVYLSLGYPGTVTLSRGFVTQTLVLYDGALSQPNTPSGTDITVNSNFVWTGGTLNSSSHVSAVTLDGATGLIAPVAAGTVMLGSNLSVVNAAVLTMYAGTVSLLNDNITFVIADQGGMRVDPGAGNKLSVEASAGAVGANLIDIKRGGYVELKSGRYEYPGAVYSDGGRIALSSETTMIVQGNGGVHKGYIQLTGVTELHGGSKLKVDPSIRIVGGLLRTRDGSGSSDATIESARMTVEGGEIWIGEETQHAYGTLTVIGSVEWKGGIFRAFVEGDSNTGQSDAWKSTDTFDIFPQAQLSLTALDGEDNVIVPTSGWRWQILWSLDSIRQLGGGGGPSYNTNVWQIDMEGQPISKWYARAK